MRFLAVIPALFCVTSIAFAQPCERCGPLSNAYGARREAGDVTAGFQLNYIYRTEAMVDGDDATRPTGVKIADTVLDFSGSYAATDWLAFNFSLPLISRLAKNGFGEDVLESGRTTDLGEAITTADFRILNEQHLDNAFLWSIRVGAKLPTGDSSDLKRESDDIPTEIESSGGFVHPHDTAFGSGSIDPVFGTSVFYRDGRFFFLTDAQCFLRTEGDYGYQYGDKGVVSGGPGVIFQLKPQHNLRLRGDITFVHAQQDEVDGTTVEDSGSTQLFVGPELMFELERKLFIAVNYDLPVFLDNDGRQLLPEYQFRAGITALF